MSAIPLPTIPQKLRDRLDSPILPPQDPPTKADVGFAEILNSHAILAHSNKEITIQDVGEIATYKHRIVTAHLALGQISTDALRETLSKELERILSQIIPVELEKALAKTLPAHLEKAFAQSLPTELDTEKLAEELKKALGSVEIHLTTKGGVGAG